jgi:hypothetical protein
LWRRLVPKTALGLVVFLVSLISCDEPGNAPSDLSVPDMSLPCERMVAQPCTVNAAAPDCGRCSDDDFLECVAATPNATEGTCVFYTPDMSRRDSSN